MNQNDLPEVPGQPVKSRLKIRGTATVTRAAKKDLEDQDPTEGSEKHADAIQALAGEKEKD